jgi:hypothetical protein
MRAVVTIASLLLNVTERLVDAVQIIMAAEQRKIKSIN